MCEWAAGVKIGRTDPLLNSLSEVFRVSERSLRGGSL